MYPYPPPVSFDELRAAKAASGIEFQIQPCPAVPGGPGRVLAFEKPPFICDAVPVPAHASLADAIAAVYSGEGTLFGALDFLRDVFGPGVVEVPDE